MAEDCAERLVRLTLKAVGLKADVATVRKAELSVPGVLRRQAGVHPPNGKPETIARRPLGTRYKRRSPSRVGHRGRRSSAKG